jgi:hypothetical protein
LDPCQGFGLPDRRDGFEAWRRGRQGGRPHATRGGRAPRGVARCRQGKRLHEPGTEAGRPSKAAPVRERGGVQLRVIQSGTRFCLLLSNQALRPGPSLAQCQELRRQVGAVDCAGLELCTPGAGRQKTASQYVGTIIICGLRKINADHLNKKSRECRSSGWSGQSSSPGGLSRHPACSYALEPQA